MNALLYIASTLLLGVLILGLVFVTCFLIIGLMLFYPYVAIAIGLLILAFGIGYGLREEDYPE